MIGILTWTPPAGGLRQRSVSEETRSLFHMRVVWAAVARGDRTPEPVMRRRVLAAARRLRRAGAGRLVLPETFSYALEEPNVCVLDIADLSVEGEEWQQDLEILKADQAVRRHFGLPLRGGEMLQPWFARKCGQAEAAG